MNLKIITSAMTDENTYIYYDETEGIVIDPGADGGEILKFIKDRSINIVGIFLTHGHYDHISAVNDFDKSIPVFASGEEKDILENPEYNFSRNIKIFTSDENLLKDSDEFTVGAAKLRVIHTPGHTKGGLCFYDEGQGILFSGDSLFYENVGRCDLYSGNYQKLIGSIKEKLFSLPKQTKVYPGHGIDTTIGHEIENNPYAKEDVF